VTQAVQARCCGMMVARLGLRDAVAQAVGILGQDDHCRRVTMEKNVDTIAVEILAVCLDFAEVCERWVDVLEGLINLLTDLGSGENDLAADEDQQDNFWLDHSVDETGEQFRLV